MKVKKARVTKKDVEDLIAWIKDQYASGKSTNTKDYPEFTKVLEDSKDKPLVWQLKKSIAYRGALNCITGEYYKPNPGESYVDICGSRYIQIDKEVLDGADPRRKDMKLLFKKVTKVSDFWDSYDSIPPEHVDFEEYPCFRPKAPPTTTIDPWASTWDRASTPLMRSYAAAYDISKIFGLHEIMPAANKDVNRPKVDMEALGDFKEWL